MPEDRVRRAVIAQTAVFFIVNRASGLDISDQYTTFWSPISLINAIIWSNINYQCWSQSLSIPRISRAAGEVHFAPHITLTLNRNPNPN